MSNGTLLQDFRIILRHVRSLSSMGTKTSSIRKHVIDQVFYIFITELIFILSLISIV